MQKTQLKYPNTIRYQNGNVFPVYVIKIHSYWSLNDNKNSVNTLDCRSNDFNRNQTITDIVEHLIDSCQSGKILIIVSRKNQAVFLSGKLESHGAICYHYTKNLEALSAKILIITPNYIGGLYLYGFDTIIYDDIGTNIDEIYHKTIANKKHIKPQFETTIIELLDNDQISKKNCDSREKYYRKMNFDIQYLHFDQLNHTFREYQKKHLYDFVELIS